MTCVSLNDSWRLFRLSSQSYSNSDRLNEADAEKKPNQLAQYFIIFSWKREFELFFLIFGCLYFLKHKYLDDFLARKLNLKETSVVLSCTSLSWKRWVILAGFQTTERCCFSLLLDVCLSYGLISEKKQKKQYLMTFKQFCLTPFWNPFIKDFWKKRRENLVLSNRSKLPTKHRLQGKAQQEYKQQTDPTIANLYSKKTGWNRFGRLFAKLWW